MGLLVREAERILPGLLDSFATPWVREAAQGVVSARFTSAGPTRGGEKVQVRFRVGGRSVAYSCPLDLVQDEVKSFKAVDAVASILDPGVSESLFRASEGEAGLLYILEEKLSHYCQSTPAVSFGLRSSPGLQRGTSPSTRTAALALQGNLRRVSFDCAATFSFRAGILAFDGVREAVAALSRQSAEAVVKISNHAFRDSGHRLKHDTAKKKLRKAMKEAYLAGLTDQELEDLRHEAIVNQVME